MTIQLDETDLTKLINTRVIKRSGIFIKVNETFLDSITIVSANGFPYRLKYKDFIIEGLYSNKILIRPYNSKTDYMIAER